MAVFLSGLLDDVRQATDAAIARAQNDAIAARVQAALKPLAKKPNTSTADAEARIREVLANNKLAAANTVAQEAQIRAALAEQKAAAAQAQLQDRMVQPSESSGHTMTIVGVVAALAVAGGVVLMLRKKKAGRR